jgi:hypothetical protein
MARTRLCARPLNYALAIGKLHVPAIGHHRLSEESRCRIEDRERCTQNCAGLEELVKSSDVAEQPGGVVSEAKGSGTPLPFSAEHQTRSQSSSDAGVRGPTPEMTEEILGRLDAIG